MPPRSAVNRVGGLISIDDYGPVTTRALARKGKVSQEDIDADTARAQEIAEMYRPLRSPLVGGAPSAPVNDTITGDISPIMEVLAPISTGVPLQVVAKQPGLKFVAMKNMGAVRILFAFQRLTATNHAINSFPLEPGDQISLPLDESSSLFILSSGAAQVQGSGTRVLVGVSKNQAA